MKLSFIISNNACMPEHATSAERGELRLGLPVGLSRLPTGEVILHPDEGFQARIHLAFQKFRDLRSARGVMCYLREAHLPLLVRPLRGPAPHAECHAVIVKSVEMKKTTMRDNIFVIPNGVDFELFHPCLRARGVTAELVVANGLSQTQVELHINASNALILSSIHEGSPNIVKETMACNVPVISTDVGDVAQVIGRTKGCKVCPADPDALATALEEALLHRGPTTGRTDIEHLECSIVAKQVIAVYEYAMRRSAKRGFPWKS